MTLFKSEKVSVSLTQHEVTPIKNLQRSSETADWERQHQPPDHATENTVKNAIRWIFLSKGARTYIFFLPTREPLRVHCSLIPKLSEVNIFLMSSNSLFILPLQGPNVVMLSQRRAVRLTHVDISSASGAKAFNVAPGCTEEKTSL